MTTSIEQNPRNDGSFRVLYTMLETVGVQVASEQVTTVSRPSLMDSRRLDASRGVTVACDELKDGSGEKSSARFGCASPRNAWKRPRRSRPGPSSEPISQGCQITSATGLSPSRTHQLPDAEEARHIPRWLTQRRDRSDHASQKTARARGQSKPPDPSRGRTGGPLRR
jgi:hypothetical protein